MAAAILRICKVLKDPISSCTIFKGLIHTAKNKPYFPGKLEFNSTIIQTRTSTSFFNKTTAEQLWKGVTSVSNAGRKRGRGKGVGKKIAKNLNRGQIIGVGKANILWPGLTAPILRGRELVQQQKLPEDPERETKLIKMRDQMGRFRPIKLSPIERGWSGTKMPGRSIGPPDPVGEDHFEGFDTKVLEMKSVFNMKGNMGRKRRMSVMVVTGNQSGLAGFALGKAVESKAALRKAKNRAAQKLIYYNIYNNHTVYHDFFCQFGKTKIFVQKKPEGYGLICHRAIKTMCEVIGIKDLYAKIEGNTNVQHIVRAFFHGLLQQKTHQQIAEEKKLHLVELRKENDYLPVPVASPTVCRTEKEILPNEVLDFTQMRTQHLVSSGYQQMAAATTPKPPTPLDLTVVATELKMRAKARETCPQYSVSFQCSVIILSMFMSVKTNLIAEYGRLQSFHADEYPECAAPAPGIKTEQASQAD